MQNDETDRGDQTVKHEKLTISIFGKSGYYDQNLNVYLSLLYQSTFAEESKDSLLSLRPFKVRLFTPKFVNLKVYSFSSNMNGTNRLKGDLLGLLLAQTSSNGPEVPRHQLPDLK